MFIRCPCIFSLGCVFQNSFFQNACTVSSKIVTQGRGAFRTHLKIYEGASNILCSDLMHFSPLALKIKISYIKKKIFYFGKWNFFAPSLKNSYIARKNFKTPSLRKFLKFFLFFFKNKFIIFFLFFLKINLYI